MIGISPLRVASDLRANWHFGRSSCRKEQENAGHPHYWSPDFTVPEKCCSQSVSS
jgi:hypothetical protein